jgi:fluoroquinolone transport system ATP-binding protein
MREVLEKRDTDGRLGRAALDGGRKAIEVRDLTFSYRGADGPAVKEMSFSVGRGEVFGFLGPSGAGKSTTQKLLIRLLKGHAGSVSVLGRDLDAWGADYYERIGVSFELPNHYQKLTALENLEFFRSLYSKETEDPMKLLEMVGLDGDAGTQVSRFSKGMQMRLTFVRAIMHRPDLLFLDEPTSGLDPVNARKVKNIVLQLKERGCTVFLTTHDMTVADGLCDRVAFVVDGRIALIDSPRQLKLRQGERKVRVECRNGKAGGEPVRREFPLNGLGDDKGFLALLRGAEIDTIHTAEATLEDVFIKATGRSLS